MFQVHHRENGDSSTGFLVQNISTLYVLASVMAGNLPLPIWLKLAHLQSVGRSWNATALPPAVPVAVRGHHRSWPPVSLCFYLHEEEEASV